MTAHRTAPPATSTRNDGHDTTERVAVGSEGEGSPDPRRMAIPRMTGSSQAVEPV